MEEKFKPWYKKKSTLWVVRWFVAYAIGYVMGWKIVQYILSQPEPKRTQCFIAIAWLSLIFILSRISSKLTDIRSELRNLRG